MTLRPMGEWLLCEVLPGDKVSAGGIVIPKMARESEPIRLAKVLAVGAGVLEKTGLRREPVVQVGDVVHYREVAAERFDALGKQQLFVKESDCLLRDPAH